MYVVNIKVTILLEIKSVSDSERQKITLTIHLGVADALTGFVGEALPEGCSLAGVAWRGVATIAAQRSSVQTYVSGTWCSSLWCTQPWRGLRPRCGCVIKGGADERDPMIFANPYLCLGRFRSNLAQPRRSGSGTSR